MIDTLAHFSSPLIRLLPHLTSPIICPPMAGAAGGSLAAAVSKAGGFGFIGVGHATTETIKREIQIAINALELHRQTPERLNIGVGLFAWQLTKINWGVPSEQALNSSSLSESDIPALSYIDACLSCMPKAVWIAFGAEDELVMWSKVIRKRDSELRIQHQVPASDKLVLFIQIGTIAELPTAVERAGADIVVAQGNEAGGHGRADSPPLSTLLPQFAAALPELVPSNPTSATPALLGAGGLADGHDLASVLRLGAHGAVFGTRFLLTPESLYTDDQKALLCRTTADQTVKSYAFDEARGTTDWPANVDGRGVYSLTVKEYDEHKLSNNLSSTAEDRRNRYTQAIRDKDIHRLITWSGTGISKMEQILPAAEVCKAITEEAAAALGTSPLLPKE